MEKDRTISLQAAIDAVNSGRVKEDGMHLWRCERNETLDAVVELLEAVPSAQPEITDCEYCHEDFDGYVRPIEKNSHAWLVRRGRTMKLHVCFKGEYRECDILFCPMCGRRLGGQNR